MALTEIARQLKNTFPGFITGDLDDVVKEYKQLYEDAESIRIGNMDYIVINGQYDPNFTGTRSSANEYIDVPEGIANSIPQNVSPLFYNSIHNKYAIIDACSSATLIDEVYSRVVYMLRTNPEAITLSKSKIAESLRNFIDSDLKTHKGQLNEDSIKILGSADNLKTVSIFRCYIIKDTGVSATSETYSFMLLNGQVKRIKNEIVDGIEGGEIRLLTGDAREVLQRNSDAIQSAVFDEYSKADTDIQRITVKSIFEVCVNAQQIMAYLQSKSAHGVYITDYFADGDIHDTLNLSTFECNTCSGNLFDGANGTAHKIHINTDVCFISPDSEGNEDYSGLFTTGCERCLEQCKVCGEWHFKYSEFISNIGKYRNVKFAPGREFIRSFTLATYDKNINYCRCREGIDWVYDNGSLTGSKDMLGVIPITQMAFINYAYERLAGYDEFSVYREEYCRKLLSKDVTSLKTDEAKKILSSFKKKLAGEYGLDSDDILIISADKCTTCSICGRQYFSGGERVFDSGSEFKCGTCQEIVADEKHMVTRIDGTVFLRHKHRDKVIITQYKLTKFGNLKKLSSRVINADEDNIKILTDEGTHN